MNKQLKKQIHKKLVSVLSVACQKLRGITLTEHKKVITMEYALEDTIPLTITFAQTPTLLVAEVNIHDGSNRFFFKMLRFGADAEKTLPGIDELVVRLLDTYIDPEGPIQSKQTLQDTPDPGTVHIKKITAINVLSSREVSDVLISCDNEEPIRVTLPASEVKKFTVGTLIIKDPERIELYDRGAYLH